MDRAGFSPLPLTVLALVLVAGALLIAGYGVPVGVGALVGLVLGTAIGVVGALWLRAGPGRSIGLAGMSWDSRAADSPFGHPVELPDWAREYGRVAGVEMGELRAIIRGGRSVEAAGARVESIALELRASGGVALAVVHTGPPDLRGTGQFVLVSVTDDAATAYVAAGEVASAGPFAGRLTIRFTPAPQPRAERLTVRIEEFADPFPGAAPRRLVGPWELVFALPRDRAEGPRPA